MTSKHTSPSAPSTRQTTRSKKCRAREPHRILDLFAGAGGWEQALAALGLRALGVETDATACATARAAGHERMQADVVELDPRQFDPVWGLVGSPPCQAYSTAGKGDGRLDKPLVIACAHELAAGNDSRAAWRQGCRDPRSLLTVEPLRYTIALRPRWVALEQVSAVLELWSLFATLLADHGYHTAAGVLSAECYGVPQTRKRAFLIASLDGPVRLPAATHRSYDARRTETPEHERHLKPWVSMAEALGWGMTARPALTVVTLGNAWGGAKSRERLRAARHVGEWAEPDHEPSGKGCAFRNGNRPRSAVRASNDPAPTIHFGQQANDVAWVPYEYRTRQTGSVPRPLSKPAPAMLAAGLAKGTPVWATKRPATTVACERRVHPPGHKQNASDPPGRYEQRRGRNAVRVTVQQAAVLQGFPADYPWQGSRTSQYTQVGNAVPPPLAERVLVEAIKPGSCKRRQKAAKHDRSRRTA